MISQSLPKSVECRVNGCFGEDVSLHCALQIMDTIAGRACTVQRCWAAPLSLVGAEFCVFQTRQIQDHQEVWGVKELSAGCCSYPREERPWVLQALGKWERQEGKHFLQNCQFKHLLRWQFNFQFSFWLVCKCPWEILQPAPICWPIPGGEGCMELPELICDFGELWLGWGWARGAAGSGGMRGWQEFIVGVLQVAALQTHSTSCRLWLLLPPT